MSRTLARRSVMLAIVMSCAFVMPLRAQDSFGGGSPQRPSPPSPKSDQRALRLPPSGVMPDRGGATATDGRSGEAQDFGVPPTQLLRPSDQLHGNTPSSIPGGKVIGTQQLSQLLQRRPGEVMLLHAFGGMEHLPGAIAVAPASQGGSFDDEVQREFAQYLKQSTGGDTQKMLVFYCAGVQCWGSYNASLRAIRMGFRNVYWYRGGLEAWRQAGLPVNGGGGQQGASR